MTHDLMMFLRARLDEDQQEAERGYLKAPEIPNYQGWDKTTTAALPPAVAVRVLADVAAKRAIVDEYEEAVRYYATNVDAPAGEAHGLRTAMRMLTLPYADHPDYQQEWTQ